MSVSTLIYMIQMISDLAFDLTVCVSWQVSFKIQDLLTLREYLVSLPCFWWGRVVQFSVLCFIFLRSVSCVLNVASISGLFILDWPSGFL